MMTGSPGSAEKLDGTGQEGRIAAMIARDAEPLPDIDDPAFGRMFDRFAGARLVLMGEASHCTSELYRARAAITRRLIAEHGFNMVAV
jgi:erythromycin esterase-like protein